MVPLTVATDAATCAKVDRLPANVSVSIRLESRSFLIFIVPSGKLSGGELISRRKPCTRPERAQAACGGYSERFSFARGKHTAGVAKIGTAIDKRSRSRPQSQTAARPRAGFRDYRYPYRCPTRALNARRFPLESTARQQTVVR